ncbi:MAG TPA: hypothetical protein VJ885_11555 [Thermoanaerobaculia bacterium]|nr:hypothetical protein [Thermoanaerobaculia bacterium]
MPRSERIESHDTRAEILEKISLDPRQLENVRIRGLSKADKARLLEVDLSDLTAIIQLTPKRPQTSRGFLDFYSPMMVSADPDHPFALFHPQFQGVTFPGVQVEFPQIKQGKKHLVEFHVELYNPSLTYKFRVFQHPLGSFQDVLIEDQQAITSLVSFPASFSGAYAASIQQRNSPTEDAGWSFHRVTITAVS